MLLTNYKSVDSPLPQLEWKCAWARRQQTSAAGLGQTKNQKQQHQEHAQNDLAVCPPGCLDGARKHNELGASFSFKFVFLAPSSKKYSLFYFAYFKTLYVSMNSLCPKLVPIEFRKAIKISAI